MHHHVGFGDGSAYGFSLRSGNKVFKEHLARHGTLPFTACIPLSGIADTTHRSANLSSPSVSGLSSYDH
jgi:hypothetical protein